MREGQVIRVKRGKWEGLTVKVVKVLNKKVTVEMPDGSKTIMSKGDFE
jgi:hypothetical protein